MLDDKARSECEQSMAMMVELYPSLWRQLYNRMIEEGFAPQQAMELLKTYILSQGLNKVSP